MTKGRLIVLIAIAALIAAPGSDRPVTAT